MPKGQKQDNLYKALAIFTCSALLFTILSMAVYAQTYKSNTYNKVTGNELEAGNWNQLSQDFLFKEPIIGKTLQRINDKIGINVNADSGFDLITHNIAASEFYGAISPSNVYSGGFGDPESPGTYTFYGNLNVNANIIGGGNILSTTGDTGGNKLCIYEGVEWVCKNTWAEVLADVPEPETGFWKKHTTKDSIYPNATNYRVGIGTEDPDFPLDVDGIGRFVEIEMNNKESTSIPKINMSTGNIENVSKITVGTIDPLYRIDGINYSTFTSAIVGGVKEELISRAMIDRKNGSGEYEHVIDFKKEKKGSELWVWYHTVDFNKDNIEVLITPYGTFAQTYYLIEGDKLIFRSDRPVEVSYRLMGKRFDWKNWPLKADDQEEAPSFTIDTK